jgi:lipid-A-disaccharide synthase
MPGSKPNKLRMGVPFVLAIADAIARRRAGTRFLIPLAPTLEPSDLRRWADPQRNPVAPLMGRTTACLEPDAQGQPQLRTSGGVIIPVVTEFPAYEAIRRCRLCLTTIGANTAELGALGMPMIVLLPTQHWESMDAWDGLLGLICRLPGVGPLIRRLVNRWMVKRVGLLAWPNIWAGEAIVPELLGPLSAEDVAERVIDYLDHPAKLEQMRQRLRAARGEPGAAARFARLIGAQLTL